MGREILDGMRQELIGCCGVYCLGCTDLKSGKCPGCRQTDWEKEDICHPVECCRKHAVSFCGECSVFPCDDMKDFYRESESHERALALMSALRCPSDSSANSSVIRDCEKEEKTVEEIRSAAHKKARAILPEAEYAVDRRTIDDYCIKVWEYPGAWYSRGFALPEGFHSTDELVDDIASETVRYFGTQRSPKQRDGSEEK